MLVHDVNPSVTRIEFSNMVETPAIGRIEARLLASQAQTRPLVSTPSRLRSTETRQRNSAPDFGPHSRNIGPSRCRSFVDGSCDGSTVGDFAALRDSGAPSSFN